MKLQDKILVDKQALFIVLQALNGPAHYIRELQDIIELQVTRGPLVGDDNPINILVEEFNNNQIKSPLVMECIDYPREGDVRKLIGFVIDPTNGNTVEPSKHEYNPEEDIVKILTGKL